MVYLVTILIRNMKKILFILLAISLNSYSQNCDTTARRYVDTYITTNGTRAITGARLNQALNKILDAVDCVDGGGVSQSALNDSITTLKNIRKVDSIYKNSAKDSIVFKINGLRYSIKDSVGSGGGGSSDSLMYNRTYLDLANDITNSALKKGATYKIEDRGDRGLFFTAISSNELSKTGQRLMLCPAKYNLGGDAYSNNWIGVWGTLLTDADVAVDDLTIRGGLVWKNLTGNIGTAPDDFTLDNTNWALVPKTSFSNGEYSEKQFDVVFDFARDWIQWQMDGFSNGVGIALNIIGYQPCDVTDWNSTMTGGVAIYGNHGAIEGVFNNVGVSPLEIANNASKVIKGNDLRGASIGIFGNKSNTITYNSNMGDIGNNSVFIITNLITSVTNVYSNSVAVDGIDGSSPPYNAWVGEMISLSFSKNTATDNSVTKLVGVNDNGETKLVDRAVGGYIPLSGTEVGSPVTGDIEVNESVKIKQDNGSYSSSITFEDGGVILSGVNGVNEASSLAFNQDGNLYFETQVASSRGVTSTIDYTANITDLDYVQKKYVDDKAGRIVELGTITYNDINSASATQYISIPLTTNDFPDSSYCVGLFYKVNDFFDGGSDVGRIYNQFNSYTYDFTQVAYANNYIQEINGVLIEESRQQPKKGAFQASLPLLFDTSNPQDYTSGSVTIYAIVKPFPF